MSGSNPATPKLTSTWESNTFSILKPFVVLGEDGGVPARIAHAPQSQQKSLGNLFWNGPKCG